MSLASPLPTSTREVAQAGHYSSCSAASCCFTSAGGRLPQGDPAGRAPGDPGGCHWRLRRPAVPRCSLALLASRSDPDNVVLCLLAADEDDDRDVALQIHFTLIQAFCCENDINILRVSNPGRLAELLLLETDANPAASEGAEQPPDLHCVLVTVREKGTAVPSGLESWKQVNQG